MKKFFTLNAYGNTYSVMPRFDMYAANGNLYCGLDEETEGPFADVTVNLGIDLPPLMACIDVNNATWLENFLVQNKIAEPTGYMIPSGFCTYPVYEFSPEFLREYAEEEVLEKMGVAV